MPLVDRHFVLLTPSGKKVGQYIGSTPGAAARKAGNRLMKGSKTSTSKALVVKEITQGSAKKTYSYLVRRIKLARKKVVIRDGKRITYAFKTTATRRSTLKSKSAKPKATTYKRRKTKTIKRKRTVTQRKK